eukprot:TRINITY_DN3713_c0_g2_i1.p1 TRINITY_DN3713_c0_g2~~TRINITY_DN3713_c0_g2_i1.p1  ORF type:complete len:148 (+),score=5.05 TRINITY_DN3713_c0_g2_i1:363-806(+)
MSAKALMREEQSLVYELGGYNVKRLHDMRIFVRHVSCSLLEDKPVVIRSNSISMSAPGPVHIPLKQLLVREGAVFEKGFVTLVFIHTLHQLTFDSTLVDRFCMKSKETSITSDHQLLDFQLVSALVRQSSGFVQCPAPFEYSVVFKL